MNTAQTWTLIVGTLAVQASTLGVVLALQWRATRAVFDRLADKIDHLDRDVQRVVDHIFREGA